MEESSVSPGNGPSDTSSLPSSSSPGSDETTEQFLERVSAELSIAWEDAFKPQSIEFMRQQMAPDFTNQAQTFHDNPFPHSQSREEHITALSALRGVNPQWKTACFNFSASVHEESGRAVVWFTSGATGKPGNEGEWTTNRESVSKLYWRRKENSNNEWECYTHECIRGPGDAQ